MRPRYGRDPNAIYVPQLRDPDEPYERQVQRELDAEQTEDAFLILTGDQCVGILCALIALGIIFLPWIK